MSLIVGVLRQHPSQPWRITVFTRPTRVSLTLPWDVIIGYVDSLRTDKPPSSSQPSISSFRQRHRWWPVWPAAPGEGRTVCLQKDRIGYWGEQSATVSFVLLSNWFPLCYYAITPFHVASLSIVTKQNLWIRFSKICQINRG